MSADRDSEKAAAAVIAAAAALNSAMSEAAALRLLVVVSVYDLQQMGYPTTQVIGVRVMLEIGNA